MGRKNNDSIKDTMAWDHEFIAQRWYGVCLLCTIHEDHKVSHMGHFLLGWVWGWDTFDDLHYGRS